MYNQIAPGGHDYGNIINPNVAYLLLVVGIVLAIMALFAPGTGITRNWRLVRVVPGWMGDQPAAHQPVGIGSPRLGCHSIHPGSAQVAQADLPGDRLGRFCHWFRLSF